jgi:tripartite-type tricarboxylate transporter receptor subunit TctC
MKRMNYLLSMLLLSFLSVSIISAPAFGATDFPKETIRIICPFSPGGGFDRQARGIAPFLQNHLPNKVSVIVENVRGAGGLVAAHQVWSAKPDGYTIFQSAVGPNMIDQFLNPKEIKFRMAEFEWIGQYRKDIRAIGIHPKLAVKNWNDFMELGKKKSILFGTSGVGSPQAREAQLIAAITGLNIGLVHYQGSNDVQAGMARGEIDATSINFNSLIRWGDDGRIFVLWDDERHPLIPDVPTALEAGVPKEQYQKIMSLPVVGTPRAFAAPPGTPPEVLKILQDAFMAAMNDPGYKAWLKKAKDIYGPVIAGDNFGKSIKLMDKSIKENMDLMQSIAK